MGRGAYCGRRLATGSHKGALKAAVLLASPLWTRSPRGGVQSSAAPVHWDGVGSSSNRIGEGAAAVRLRVSERPRNAGSLQPCL